MTRRELIDYCLTYADAYEDYPFHDDPSAGKAWAAIRHKKNKKAFAFIYERDGLCVNLKCEPMRADFLRQVHTGVTPAYHMNKQHWNTVAIGSDVSDEDLHRMIEHSFCLTMPKDIKQQRTTSTLPGKPGNGIATRSLEHGAIGTNNKTGKYQRK